MSVAKIGLKLWSINNKQYLQEAIKLYDDGVFDYVELYSVPESEEYISYWKSCPFPFIIHCAHSMHGFNLSLASSQERNKNLFCLALEYVEKLSAEKLIIHPGVWGNQEKTIEQLSALIHNYKIDSNLILVENKPLVTLTYAPCVGTSPNEIQNICEQCHTGFVLDISHAIKYAIGVKCNWQHMLGDFMQLRPSMLHICDGNMDNFLDEHLHLDKGQFDFLKIFEICQAKFISIESNKNSKENLDDFVDDVRRLKKYLKIV